MYLLWLADLFSFCVWSSPNLFNTPKVTFEKYDLVLRTYLHSSKSFGSSRSQATTLDYKLYSHGQIFMWFRVIIVCRRTLISLPAPDNPLPMLIVRLLYIPQIIYIIHRRDTSLFTVHTVPGILAFIYIWKPGWESNLEFQFWNQSQ